jgi:hypothetical protein
VNSNQQKRVKLLSAVIGASAVVAMGAVGVAVANEQAGTGTVGAVPEATPGAATTTTPPTAPVTSIATPPMTATTPAGFR